MDERFRTLLGVPTENLTALYNDNREICNSKNFWIERYKFYGVPLIKFESSFKLNIQEYIYSTCCLEKACVLRNELIKGKYICIFVDSPDMLSSFDVPGIDIDGLKSTFLPRFNAKMSGVETEYGKMDFSLHLTYDNPNYQIIDISSDTYYKISELNVLNVLHSIVYRSGEIKFL